jgi:hypothetical protein
MEMISEILCGMFLHHLNISLCPSSSVYVEEVVSKGEADRAGVMVGDVMTRCSAVTLKDGSREGEQEGYGERLYNNWETVMFDCKDQVKRGVLQD